MKIDKFFYKKYSINDIKKFLDENLINPNDLVKFSLNGVNSYKNFKFLTSSSYKYLKNFKFDQDLSFKKNYLLSCIPFLAKDIFNTVNFNTEMGSEIWKNFRAGNNARAIDSLISEGSILIGKSTTAEFAVHHENMCQNAIDKTRLPGTSSTGSAVGVSLGVVPFALGTQTAGSIVRPASYNGIYGIKPTFGMIPRTGVLKTCDTLDTIGFLTSKFENIKPILNSIRVKGKNYPYVNDNVDFEKKILLKNIKISFIKTYTWSNLQDYNQIQFLNYIKNVKNFFKVDEINMDKKFSEIHELHKKIYYKSLSYYFKREKKLGIKLSKTIKHIIKKGQKISSNEFKESIYKQNYLIEEFDKITSNFDLLIAPGTAGVAPKKGELEKNDSALIWTFLHVPTIFAPLFKGPNQLPFGVQFIGKKWSDLQICNILETFKKNNLLN